MNYWYFLEYVCWETHKQKRALEMCKEDGKMNTRVYILCIEDDETCSFIHSASKPRRPVVLHKEVKFKENPKNY